MSAVEEKKQERTKAKQQVTTALRRLTRAVDRGVDIDILTVLMVELEKAFDDFCIIDEEYEILVSDEEHAEHEIVNGLDLTAYRANVSEVYTGARNAFVQAKAAKTTSVAQLDLVPHQLMLPPKMEILHHQNKHQFKQQQAQVLVKRR